MAIDGTRSTIDLVETCIVTLVLCSWTSIHLDIPGKSDRGHRLHAIWQKVQWTITGILFPEMILWMAFAEFWEARWLCFELEKLNLKEPESQRGNGGDGEAESQREKGRDGGVKPQAAITVNKIKSEIPAIDTSLDTPTATRAKCEKCGSFKCVTTHLASASASANCNRSMVESRLSQVRQRIRKYRELFKWPIYPKGLEVGFYIEMGGLEIDVEGDPNAVTGRVTSSGALFLKREKLFPLMDIARIKDQSKSDMLAKILVCIQASWMVLQCIARGVVGLPLSLLELNTVMHVMCTLLIYGMWFKKPQDVGFPKTITPADATKDLTCHQIGKLKQHLEPLEQSGSMQLNSSTKTDIAEVSIFIGAILGLIMSGIYGGVHLTVWYGHFPSRLERALWRISGCIIVGMPVFLVVFVLMLKLVRDAANQIHSKGFGRWEVTTAHGWTYRSSAELAETGVHPKTSWNLYKQHSGFIKDLIDQKKRIMLAVYIVLVAFQTIATAIYLSARAYVVVEAFLSLRNLPKGVYTKVPWVELVPHFRPVSLLLSLLTSHSFHSGPFPFLPSGLKVSLLTWVLFWNSLRPPHTITFPFCKVKGVPRKLKLFIIS